MKKPVLYVGLHGPILVPSLDEQDNFLLKKITDYAKPFLHWAKENFDVRWLSDTGARDALYTAQRLSLPHQAIPVASYADSKTEAMDPKEDFYWVDSELIPAEVAWLHEHQHELRFIQVDPHVGVTPLTKETLQQRQSKTLRR